MKSWMLVSRLAAGAKNQSARKRSEPYGNKFEFKKKGPQDDKPIVFKSSNRQPGCSGDNSVMSGSLISLIYSNYHPNHHWPRQKRYGTGISQPSAFHRIAQHNESESIQRSNRPSMLSASSRNKKRSLSNAVLLPLRPPFSSQKSSWLLCQQSRVGLRHLPKRNALHV